MGTDGGSRRFSLSVLVGFAALIPNLGLVISLGKSMLQSNTGRQLFVLL